MLSLAGFDDGFARGRREWEARELLTGAEAGEGGLRAMCQPDAGDGLGTRSSVGRGAKRVGRAGSVQGSRGFRP